MIKGEINTKFLDGLRFLFALWVALVHFYSFLGGKNFIEVPLSRIWLNGANPVSGFIVITGFLMMYHYLLRGEKEPPNDKNTIIKFWLRRVFRLYPVYIIAILLAFFTSKVGSIYNIDNLKFFTNGIVDGYNQKLQPIMNFPDIGSLISHLTFVHGLIPLHVVDILGPAWSLSLEMQFYLLFPLIFLLFFYRIEDNRLRIILLIIVSTIIAKLMPILFGIYGDKGLFAHFPQPSIILYQLPLFLYGMLLATVGLGKLNIKFLFLGITSVLLTQGIIVNLIVIFLTFFMFLDYFKDKNILNKLIYVSFFNIRKLLSGKIAHFGANISYSLYLIHIITIPFIVKGTILISSMFSLNTLITFIIALLCFFGINFLLSTILYNFVEKPFIKIGKDYIVFLTNKSLVRKHKNEVKAG